MKLVAIESPLAGNFVRNRRYALWCVYHCYTLGEAAYASHLFYPQCLDDTSPDQRKFGMAAGLAWASQAELRIFYTDLGISKGMKASLISIKEEGGRYENRRIPLEFMEKFQAELMPGATEGFSEALAARP